MPVAAQGYAAQMSDTTKDAHSCNDAGKKIDNL